MFGLGLQEVLVVLLLFLFFFGAKKLPEIGSGLGKTLREIRKIRGERDGEKKEKEKVEAEKEGDLVSDLKKDVQEIPGIKEIRDIKKAADEIKDLTRILK